MHGARRRLDGWLLLNFVAVVLVVFGLRLVYFGKWPKYGKVVTRKKGKDLWLKKKRKRTFKSFIPFLCRPFLLLLLLEPWVACVKQIPRTIITFGA